MSTITTRHVVVRYRGHDRTLCGAEPGAGGGDAPCVTCEVRLTGLTEAAQNDLSAEALGKTDPFPESENGPMMIVAMHAMAIVLRRLAWVGAGSPWQEQWQAEMRKAPVAGDLVIETSTMPLCDVGDEKDFARIGIFIREVREPYAEWDEERDGPNLGERVTYIRAFDSREIRWTNADFARLPFTLDDAYGWFEKDSDQQAGGSDV